LISFKSLTSILPTTLAVLLLLNCSWLNAAVGRKLVLVNLNVADLPSSPPDGTIAYIEDGNAANDCTTGTGSTQVMCIYDGSAWNAITGVTGGDILYESELDSESELETQLTDVSNVFTNNDGALDDDDITDDASTSLTDTADLLYETELDSESELETQIADMANIIQAAEIDAFSEVQALVADKTLINEEDAPTFDVDVSVPDEVYGAGWNASVEVPTKNAVYDKIEAVGGSSEWTDTGTILHSNEETADEIAIGGTTEAGADIFLGVDGVAVFNEQGGDSDFRIEGDDNTNLLNTDAGLFSGKGSIGLGAAAANTGFVNITPAAFTSAADTDIAVVQIKPTGVTIPTGTTGVAASLRVSEPVITETGTVTNVSAIYVDSSAHEGTNNYALWVDTGAVRIDEQMLVNDGQGDFDTQFKSDTNDFTFFIDASEDNLGFGTNTPATQVEVYEDTAATDAVVDVLTLSNNSTGTVAAGFGVGISFELEDAAGNEQQASQDVVLTTVTDGAEDADMFWTINQSGALTEILRLDASGDSAIVSGTVATDVGLDGVGAVDLDYGSADITDHTFVTDGTGTAEVVLPAGSIDSTEILDETILEADLKGVDGPADEEILTFEATTGDFEWEAPVVEGCRVTDAGAQTITTATTTNLEFDTETYDYNTIHDTSTNNDRITFEQTGVYIITCHANFASNGTGERMLLIEKNGTTLIAQQEWDTNEAGRTFMSITTMDSFTPTEYVVCQVRQTSGGNLNIEKLASRSPEFAAHFIHQSGLME